MLKRIDNSLYDWVEFNTLMLENSSLGYAPRTTIGRMMEEGCNVSDIFSSRVPFLRKPPPHIADIDKVLRHLPEDLLGFFKQHYVDRSTRMTRPVYKKLDQLHYAIQGGLWMLR